MLRKLVVAFAAAALAAQPASAQPLSKAVSIELSLLVDVSGSISAPEYTLQKTGYVNVFNKQSFWDAFSASGRSLAVQYTEWSGATQQSSTNWYEITNFATAQTFATVISNFNRAFNGNTAPGDAIKYGVGSIQGNAFAGTKKIIDISSDGCRNAGIVNVAGERDAASALGITINAITIGTDAAAGCDLDGYYKTNVVTANGFHIASTGFDTFGAAIETKIGTEIGVVPEPSSAALIGIGMFGLVAIRRRRNARV